MGTGVRESTLGEVARCARDYPTLYSTREYVAVMPHRGSVAETFKVEYSVGHSAPTGKGPTLIGVDKAWALMRPFSVFYYKEYLRGDVGRPLCSTKTGAWFLTTGFHCEWMVIALLRRCLRAEIVCARQLQPYHLGVKWVFVRFIAGLPGGRRAWPLHLQVAGKQGRVIFVVSSSCLRFYDRCVGLRCCLPGRLERCMKYPGSSV